MFPLMCVIAINFSEFEEVKTETKKDKIIIHKIFEKIKNQDFMTQNDKSILEQPQQIARILQSIKIIVNIINLKTIY